jgi:hypothetical protein
MHQPYQELLKHPHDFVVSYRFFTPEEGGRHYPPIQGIQFNFRYQEKDLNAGSNFMIWPEFEDEEGKLILNKDTPVAMNGKARMWIAFPERRSFHQARIRIGTKGYFMEGKPIAECEVIEIVGLLTNPISNKR